MMHVRYVLITALAVQQPFTAAINCIIWPGRVGYSQLCLWPLLVAERFHLGSELITDPEVFALHISMSANPSDSCLSLYIRDPAQPSNLKLHTMISSSSFIAPEACFFMQIFLTMPLMGN